MDRVVRRFAVQPAVYWAPLGDDGLGSMILAPPREIRVRWDDAVVVKHDALGREIVCQAQVLVRERVMEQGRLWLGRLEDLREGLAGHEILRVEITPAPRSTMQFVHVAYLGRGNRV